MNPPNILDPSQLFTTSECLMPLNFGKSVEYIRSFSGTIVVVSGRELNILKEN